MAPRPSSVELIDIFKQGSFIAEMANRFDMLDETDEQAVVTLCVDLHNEGSIDLLHLVESGSFQELSNTEFFSATHFLCKILPELKVSPERLMACVDTLVKHGEGDLVANQPNEALREWCTRDILRADKIISEATGGDELASRYLTFALEAKRSIPEARQIALTYNDARRLSAVTALGRIKDEEATSRSETISCFQSLLDSNDDDVLLANILSATLFVASYDFKNYFDEIRNLLERLVEQAGVETLHCSAKMLWQYAREMNPEMVVIFLDALKDLDSSNKGTVRTLDHGLMSLLEHGHDDVAIAFVEHVISKEAGGLKLEEFGSFTNSLLSGSAESLSGTVLKWLMLGEPNLCYGLSKAFNRSKTRNLPLIIRAEDIPKLSVEQFFLSRKAIGWFFFSPITAVSIIISVLRICDTKTAEQLQSLLVDWMLLNWSSVGEYLEGLSPDDDAKKHIEKALREDKTYLESLNLIPAIKELQPSEYNRRIDLMLRSDEMRDIFKKTQSESLFFNIAKHSVLLYGNSSLSFRTEDNGELKPLETNLQPFESSYEIPRLTILDPVGLEIAIRTFKTEVIVS